VLLRILQQCQARQNNNQDVWVPCILEANESSKEYRKNWARLIQKIYEVDPLTCPKCQGMMRIISFIQNEEVIKKILKHLGLWDVKYSFAINKSFSSTQYLMINICNTSRLAADN
jgi:hypothetical protein